MGVGITCDQHIFHLVLSTYPRCTMVTVQYKYKYHALHVVTQFGHREKSEKNSQYLKNQ